MQISSASRYPAESRPSDPACIRTDVGACQGLGAAQVKRTQLPVSLTAPLVSSHDDEGDDRRDVALCVERLCSEASRLAAAEAQTEREATRSMMTGNAPYVCASLVGGGAANAVLSQGLTPAQARPGGTTTRSSSLQSSLCLQAMRADMPSAVSAPSERS